MRQTFFEADPRAGVIEGAIIRGGNVIGIDASGDALIIVRELRNDRPLLDNLGIRIDTGADVPRVAEMLPADGVAVHQGEQIQKLSVCPDLVILKRDLLLIRLIIIRIIELDHDRKLREFGRIRGSRVFTQILPDKADAFRRSVNQAG